jgi:hypothetical protein
MKRKKAGKRHLHSGEGRGRGKLWHKKKARE